MPDTNNESADDAQLINMDDISGTPPGKTARGDTWRTVRVYRCAVCHTKTNRWVCSGYPGKGPRLVCPAQSATHHDEIEELLARRDEPEDRLDQYEGTNSETTDRLIDRLHDEIEVINNRVATLRDRIDDHDDVVDVGDDHETRSFNENHRIDTGVV